MGTATVRPALAVSGVVVLAVFRVCGDRGGDME